MTSTTLSRGQTSESSSSGLTKWSPWISVTRRKRDDTCTITTARAATGLTKNAGHESLQGYNQGSEARTFGQSYESRLLLLQVSSVNRGGRVHEVTHNQANVAIACRIRRYLTMLRAEGGVLSNTRIILIVTRCTRFATAAWFRSGLNVVGVSAVIVKNDPRT
jgi:hypothetical protein